jgi:hypothetical protein
MLIILTTDPLFNFVEDTEGTIKTWTTGETGNIGHTRRRKAKQALNTTCAGHNDTQTNQTTKQDTSAPTNNWR